MFMRVVYTMSIFVLWRTNSTTERTDQSSLSGQNPSFVGSLIITTGTSPAVKSHRGKSIGAIPY